MVQNNNKERLLTLATSRLTTKSGKRLHLPSEVISKIGKQLKSKSPNKPKSKSPNKPKSKSSNKLKSKSPNVEVEKKKDKKKYLTKAIKIATQTLKKKYDLPFEIKFKNGKDIDLELPIIKNFGMTSLLTSYHYMIAYKRTVLYYNIPEWKKKKGYFNYQIYYNNRNGGSGAFEKRLNSVYEYIMDDIRKFISTNRHMPEQKVVFDQSDGDDRYTFFYSIKNKILSIELRSLDIHLKSSVIHNLTIDLSETHSNYNNDTSPSPVIDYIHKKLTTTFITKLKNHSKNGLPLAYLILSEDAKKYLHIIWGYTFKDARGKGYSTVLRKIVQIYAYDKDINFVTAEPMTYASQRATKSAGFFQMPEERKIKVLPTRSINVSDPYLETNIFKPNNKSFKSLRDAALRKAVYMETNLVPHRQKKWINNHKDGLNFKYFNIENLPNGTHVRKIGGRENIPKNMIHPNGKYSLHK